MTTTGRDPRIDAYVARAAPFARPVLEYFREQVHAACPEVEEQIKWGHPAFMHHGIMCGMAAFKQHCAFNFWKGRLLLPGNEARVGEAMGQFGRVTSTADLAAALARNTKARKAFESFPPSHRREYVEWISEAKRAETRARRLASTLEWLADGKARNWKYT